MKKAYKTDRIAIAWAITVCTLVLGAFTFTAHAQTVESAMGPGDSGADVSALQTFLAADTSVYPEGLVTGYYGSLTTSAVQRYQCKEGIVCSGDVSSTGYGRVGPATLAAIQAAQGGLHVPPVLSGGPDLSAPVLGPVAVTTTSTSAVIHWTTNEPAHSRVMFATYWPFLYASAPAVVDASFDTSSDVTLTGLAPNTTYFFVLESVDAYGNLQWGINHSFKTDQ